jgi:predicted nuclease of restriction endonuclease-like (RecB) superfamily
MAKTYDPIKTPEYADLLKNIKERITETQYEALKSVNKELIALYWDIGRMIVERQDKESWGKSVVELLSKDLQTEFPGIRGFLMQNLWYRPTPLPHFFMLS